jgi:hypothetical protein
MSNSLSAMKLWLLRARGPHQRDHQGSKEKATHREKMTASATTLGGWKKTRLEATASRWRRPIE